MSKLIVILLSLCMLISCSPTSVVKVNKKYSEKSNIGRCGCWLEDKEDGTENVCGIAIDYNPRMDTYVMASGVGWAMNIKSCYIKWE